VNEQRDNSGRLSIELHPQASEERFAAFASALAELSGSPPVEKLANTEQKYWDFRLDDATLVLHMDTFAGISIHTEDGSRDDLLRNTAQDLLKRVSGEGPAPDRPAGGE
jgi:hypothetical protein